MKKQVFCRLMCMSLLLIVLTGCQSDLPAEVNTPTSQAIPSDSYSNHSQEPVEGVDPTTNPSSQTPQSSPTETPIKDGLGPKAKSLFEVGKAVYATDLGFDSFGSIFYWSPDNREALLTGSTKNGEGKYTSAVYYYNFMDQKIIKILQGELGEDFYLDEPIWSADGQEVLLSFSENYSKKEPAIYIYNIRNEKLEALLISGHQAEFSTDGTKILYVGTDKSLHIYQRSDGTIQSLPDELRGRTPLWFSDNRHILFFKGTGKNPYGLDGAELYSLCILDTQKPEEMRVLGDERVYQNLHWVVQDNVAWVDSGWDDGHYVSLLNINKSEVQELGGMGDNLYLTAPNPRIIWRQDNAWRVYDTQLKNYTEYRVSPDQSIMPLSVLPDNRLLFWKSTLNDRQKSNLLAVSTDGHTSVLTEDNSFLYPRISPDGSEMAFIDSDGGFLITVDAMMLCER